MKDKNDRLIIQSATKFAKEKLKEFDGGHDWSHTERVVKMSMKIHESEQEGDPFIIELAAILHDIADTKFHKGSEEDGGNMARDFLISKGLDADKAEHIRHIINMMSFKKIHDSNSEKSIEFQIVQDADRLDAMGAIGIARAFNYGGYKKRPLYDPEQQPLKYESSEAYKNSKAPTINHFYEKLLLLKDLMNTSTGKKLAAQRHSYMEEYIKQFFSEWKGLE